jgi:hypothetical protein
MIEAVCDCGAVRLEVTTAPTEVNDCPCAWCQRLGALWAYYPTTEVRIASPPDATAIYRRAAHRLEFHRCKTCGLTTHWSNTAPDARRMGVNSRLMAEEVRARARVYRGG